VRECARKFAVEAMTAAMLFQMATRILGGTS
jgi:hypothetical protein